MITINNSGGECAVNKYQMRDIEPQGQPLSRRPLLGRKPEVREARVRPKKKESTVMKKVLVAGAIALALYLLAMGALRS